MTHIITSLCLRDGGCVEVCPVECIVPGKPDAEWPWYYIDPDTCIDCGACIPECPFEAIFPRRNAQLLHRQSGEFINKVSPSIIEHQSPRCGIGPRDLSQAGEGRKMT
jgi:ferredoxin